MSYDQNSQDDAWRYIKRAGLASALSVVVSLAGCPPYRVWNSEMTGLAKLAESENARKVLIEQARAEQEAAKMRAEAIAIVGKAAKEYPEYRQQEFLGAFAEALKEGNISQIMYIPTEASIPITEAGRSVQVKKEND